MNLRELELKLLHIRQNVITRMVHNVNNRQYVLQPVVIRKIDNGGNYYLYSLLMYLESLGLTLLMNNRPIESLLDIGIVLKGIRENLNLTIKEMKHPLRSGLREIKRLENGEGGSRRNLEEYIEILNKNNEDINFDLLDKYGLLG